MATQRPRIIGVSALLESMEPARVAMATAWPQAEFHQIFDESLLADLAALGGLGPPLFERIRRLARYAAEAHHTGRADGVLFTCSAFASAIEAAKADLPIPVVTPNEGAFETALDLCATTGPCGAINLLVTFAGSASPLTKELERRAAARGVNHPAITVGVVEGALAALHDGDLRRHDTLIVEAGAALGRADVTIIGQFSMARARPALAARRQEPVLATPEAAARALRRLVERTPGDAQ